MNVLKPLMNELKARTNGNMETVVLLRMIIYKDMSKLFVTFARIRKGTQRIAESNIHLIPYIMDMQKVYIENRQSVFSHVNCIVKNFHDSEEVCNDVFLKMIRLNTNPKTAFNPKLSALTTWIRTITHSVILDYFRTNHQDKYIPVSNFVNDADGVNDENKIYYKFVAPKADQADDGVLTTEVSTKINNAIEKLDIKYRRVAILYFLWEYEYSEIAVILNVPMGTVKGMLSRSRAKLQDSLKDAYVLRKAVSV